MIPKTKHLFLALAASASPAFTAQVNTWESIPVGTGGTGNTSYNSSNSTYTMTSTNMGDIVGQSDNFQFLFKSISGDGQIIARIDSFSNTLPWSTLPGNKSWSKAGVMVRATTAANAANYFFFIRPEDGSAGQIRKQGDMTYTTYTTWADVPPVDTATDESWDFKRTSQYRARYLLPGKWLSATRVGNTVTTYSSDDGKCWNLRTKETVGLTGSVLLGVAVTSNNVSNGATAVISNLQLNTTVPSNINAQCDRAQVDGDLAAPTSFVPTVNNVWSITQTNPDPNPEIRSCFRGQAPGRYATGVDSPNCPLDLGFTHQNASASTQPNPAGTAPGVGIANCTGAKNCNDVVQNTSYPYIDLNPNTGYKWFVGSELGGMAQVFLKLAAGPENATPKVRSMNLLVNGIVVETISIDNTKVKRTTGGIEFGPYAVPLNAALDNKIELTPTTNNVELFDVFYLRVENGPVPIPSWMKAGYSTSSWQSFTGNQLKTNLINGRVDGAPIWMRAEVDLTEPQKNNLMFYGSWTNSVSIYVNGTLATTTYRSQLVSMTGANKNVERKHYLGLNGAARGALKVGRNVIAVRFECVGDENPFMKPCNSDTIADAEFGMTENSKLAAIPTAALNQLNPDDPEAKSFLQYGKEQAAIGGAFGKVTNNVLTSSIWFGWTQKDLATPIAKEPVLRIASVDKRITSGLTGYLVNNYGIQNGWGPNYKFFMSDSPIIPLGGQYGTNVQNVTLEQLRANKAGISEDVRNSQGWQDQLAFKNKIHARDLKSEHLIANWISQPTLFTPSDTATEKYSSNGQMMLRYILAYKYAQSKNITGGTPASNLERIFKDMGYDNIRVARENPLQRVPTNTALGSEPGYMIADRETRSRWVELDEYLAIAGRPSELAAFMAKHGAEVKVVNGAYVRVLGGQGGASDGIRPFGYSNQLNDASAGAWNGDLAGVGRFDDLRTLRNNGTDTLGTCNPAKASANAVRIYNANREGSEKYLSLDTNKNLVTQAFKDQDDWKWKYEAVLDAANKPTGKYRIKVVLEGVEYYLQLVAAGGIDVTAKALPPNASLAEWKLTQVKGDNGPVWLIESLDTHEPFKRYLYSYLGTVRVGQISDPQSFVPPIYYQWYPCT